MRRILLLITDLEIGGTPTVVRELAIRLNDHHSAEVEVACLARRGPVGDQLLQAGIEVTAFNAVSPASLPIVAWRLKRHVQKRGIDTVLSFLVHANVVAALTSRFVDGVLWLQSIQTTQPTPRWHWNAQKLAQSEAEKIVVPSPSVARIAQEWAKVREEKIVVIPNAIDCGTGGLPVSWPQNTGGPPAPQNTRIVFIGRLDPIKRIPDLVSAMSLLDSSFRLDIFGEGPERKTIEAAVARHKLNERIILHGAIEGPHEVLQHANLLVLPSKAEGFGLVLIEAMAAGVPVVATNVPGICDVVQNGQTGVLVPVADPSALAAAIKSLMSDHDRRRRLVAAGLEDVRARFSWDVVLPAYRSLLGITPVHPA